jgi:adenylate cyclase class 1
MDKQMLDDSPLGLVLEQNREGVLQMFYQVRGGRAQVYILDERGSLFHQRVAFHDRYTLLGQFQNFLDSMRYRLSNMNVPNGLHENENFLYYQINRNNQDQYVLDPVTIAPASGPLRYMDVQIIGDLEDEQHSSFSIFCGNREFSALEFGKSLFGKVAEYITRKRSSGSSYPIYITDIDVNPTMLMNGSPDGVQSVHFLNYKKRIESLLNEALQNGSNN